MITDTRKGADSIAGISSLQSLSDAYTRVPIHRNGGHSTLTAKGREHDFRSSISSHNRLFAMTCVSPTCLNAPGGIGLSAIHCAPTFCPLQLPAQALVAWLHSVSDPGVSWRRHRYPAFLVQYGNARLVNPLRAHHE